MEAKGNYNQMDSAWKKIVHYDLEGNYLCNRKCNTYPQKRTLIKEDVTCSQCILRLNRNEKNKQKIIKVNGDFEIKENIEENIEPKKRNYKSPISEKDLDLLRNKIKNIKI